MNEPPQPEQQPPAAQGAGRFIAGVFGVAFAGIGLTVMISLWFSDGMGDPPVFFKLIGSLIALVFMAMGGTMAFSAITGRGMMAPRQTTGATTGTTPSGGVAATAGYTCPHCGAGLARDAEVSPMGDVKCSFCGRWFNVHGQT
jgi:hypothetical protein